VERRVVPARVLAEVVDVGRMVAGCSGAGVVVGRDDRADREDGWVDGVTYALLRDDWKG
jgi:hypothetical protein